MTGQGRRKRILQLSAEIQALYLAALQLVMAYYCVMIVKSWGVCAYTF